MSLKQELQVWQSALQAFEAGDHALALARFEEISDTSKVVFNMALIHAIGGEHDQAVALFDRAIALDNFLAIAYFQSGVSQFLLGRYEAARRDFSDALALFRDNHTIDYDQLGLDFKLFSCEVRFNRGLSLIHMGRLDEGMLDLAAAREDKQTSEHDVIDEACADQAVGYTVFSIPVGVLFRPANTKLQNLETRDYLGKATVIAATNSTDLFIGFGGAKKLAATAGVAPPDGFVQAAKPGPRPKRSNTGDGRLERAPTYERSAARGEGGAGLGRSQTARAPSTMTGTTTVSRSGSTATGRRIKPSGLPTPPSSTASAQEEQVFPSPPKGLLHARSDSSSLNGSRTQRYPERATPPRTDGFYVPSRPPRPADDLHSLPPPSAPTLTSSLSTRRGRKPAPIAPLSTLLDIPRPTHPVPSPPQPQGEPSPSGQAPERVASWAQGQRHKHERAASSPSALPTTPRVPVREPVVGEEAAPQQQQQQLSPSELAYVAEDAESDADGVEPFTLARYDSVARSAVGVGVGAAVAGAASAGERAVKLEVPQVEARDPSRRMGAIEMLASEMRMALQLEGGPQVGEAGEGGAVGQETLATAAKIRVKLQYQGETRALNIPVDAALGEFVERVRRKFGSESDLPIKYRDSDGGLVSILDEDDWECALDTARDRAAGGKCGGRLDIVVGEG
ncbi:hypothetical protein JCM8208_002243 [Rhodotorula glutinis]